MNTDGIAKLFEVVKKKSQIDQTNSWSNGSSTYLGEIKKELVEVEEEIHLDRLCYLEDELGDVLWDYLNLLLCLENEKGISAANVFGRALSKYDERISGIEAGIMWAETKAMQKKRLSDEYRSETTNADK